MKTFYAKSISLLALVLLASACAPQATPALTEVPTIAPTDTVVPATEAPTDTAAATMEAPTATMASSSGSSTVTIALSSAPGAFLVDGDGMTLYLFTKDTPNNSTCYDSCATNWPPLTVSGAPVAGNGVDATKLGTLQRTDGSMQVTYNGWPLYYFAKDAKTGDTMGQGVGSVWYEVSAAGDKITQ